MDISVIVPFYNEEGNLKKLFDEIKINLDKLTKDWEIIFINDGSNDESEKEVKFIQENNRNVELINFVRNFGQTAGWAAGFDQAKGKLLITIDADLQNDPADIAKMLELMEKENADVVTGWRKNRHDKWLRSALSKMANKVIAKVMKVDLHDAGCSLRLIKKDKIKHIKLYGEMHRLLPYLLSSSGLKVVEVEVKHHERYKGVSKYNYSRILKVFLDLLLIKFLSAYQTKPIYLYGMFGFSFIFVSIILGIFIFFRWIFMGGVLVSPLFSVAITLNIFGVIYILLGLLAEIQMRVWYEGSGKKSYEIKE